MIWYAIHTSPKTGIQKQGRQREAVGFCRVYQSIACRARQLSRAKKNTVIAFDNIIESTDAVMTNRVLQITFVCTLVVIQLL